MYGVVYEMIREGLVVSHLIVQIEYNRLLVTFQLFCEPASRGLAVYT